MTRSFIVAAMLALLATGCDEADGATTGSDPSAQKEPPAASATRVEVAVIEPTAARLQLSLPGEVIASRDADLSAPLGGFVEKVAVAAGDEVRKGQILALVDTASHGAKAEQTRVELDTARRELERQKLLGKAAPQASLDAAKSRYEAAKAAHRSAQVAVDRSVIEAPFAGVVAEVEVEVGETASPGAPLMRLVQLDTVDVTASLSDRDVLRVRKGMTAKVRTDARGSWVEGTVELIRPAADTRTRSFVAEIEVPNEDRRLLPGMIAKIRMSSDVAADQLVISQDWLVTKPSSLGVFVEEDGVARWREIEVGPIVRDRVVIHDGLSEGDVLVINGHRELAEGDELLVARKGVCCVDGRVDYTTGQDSAEAASTEGAGDED